MAGHWANLSLEQGESKGRGKDEEKRKRKEWKEIIIIPLNIKNSVRKEWLGN